MIHKHVSQLGFTERNDATLGCSSTLLRLMIEHFTEAPHEIHKRGIDKSSLLLMTSVRHTSPLAPLTSSKIDDPNDGRVALCVLPTTRTGLGANAAVVVGIVLGDRIRIRLSHRSTTVKVSNLQLTNGVGTTRVGIDIVRCSMTIVLCLLCKFKTLMNIANGMLCQSTNKDAPTTTLTKFQGGWTVARTTRSCFGFVRQEVVDLFVVNLQVAHVHLQLRAGSEGRI
mmetsp:Transcript_1442/g.3372  ORF Transcript_1442/g.3372 Transcript_1442/m.3372 type:complete len:226 (-) Transcript_1442:95-772(-)